MFGKSFWGAPRLLAATEDRRELAERAFPIGTVRQYGPAHLYAKVGRKKKPWVYYATQGSDKATSAVQAGGVIVVKGKVRDPATSDNLRKHGVSHPHGDDPPPPVLPAPRPGRSPAPERQPGGLRTPGWRYYDDFVRDKSDMLRFLQALSVADRVERLEPETIAAVEHHFGEDWRGALSLARAVRALLGLSVDVAIDPEEALKQANSSSGLRSRLEELSGTAWSARAQVVGEALELSGVVSKSGNRSQER